AVQLSGWELRVSDIGRGSTESYDLDRGVLRHGGVVGAEVRQIALQTCGPGELEVAGGQRVQTLARHRGDVDGNGAVLGVLEVGQGRTRAVGFVPAYRQGLRARADSVEVPGAESQQTHRCGIRVAIGVRQERGDRSDRLPTRGSVGQDEQCIGVEVEDDLPAATAR